MFCIFQLLFVWHTLSVCWWPSAEWVRLKPSITANLLQLPATPFSTFMSEFFLSSTHCPPFSIFILWLIWVLLECFRYLTRYPQSFNLYIDILLCFRSLTFNIFWLLLLVCINLLEKAIPTLSRKSGTGCSQASPATTERRSLYFLSKVWSINPLPL